MQELRFNPLTDEWIIVSTATQRRPVQPTEVECPICPGGVEFKDVKTYDIVSFENRYPSLRRDAPELDFKEKGPFRKERALGVCEVVVYTSDHDSSLPKMPLDQVAKLVKVWKDRTRELSNLDFVKYIFIFENRGKEVGASLPHPHGQIYAFPFVPKRIEAKIDAMRKWFERTGKCPICDVIENESWERTVYENESFLALVPFYARFPYEIHIYPKRHVSTLLELSEIEEKDLADSIKNITMRYDKLFEQEFPYMMMLFQAPFTRDEISHFFHFHLEFNPPKRDKDRLKWMASVETGTWTFINPVLPEEAAKRLREVKI